MQKSFEIKPYRVVVVRWMVSVLWYAFFCLPAHSKERSPVLLVLGDSLSAAFGIPTEQGWVALLEEHLAEQGSAIQVVNASVSGATTSAGLSLLPALLEAHQPRWVMLELGANDGLQGKPIPFIETQLLALVENVKAAGAEPIIFGMMLPPNYGDRYTKPFTALFPKLAQQFDVLYVPFFLEGVAGNSELMQADGLHPNAQGQPRILENVLAASPDLLSSQLSEKTMP